MTSQSFYTFETSKHQNIIKGLIPGWSPSQGRGTDGKSSQQPSVTSNYLGKFVNCQIDMQCCPRNDMIMIDQA